MSRRYRLDRPCPGVRHENSHRRPSRRRLAREHTQTDREHELSFDAIAQTHNWPADSSTPSFGAPALASALGASVTTLVLKLAIAPAFAIATSLAARRFGARIGGVVGGLPMIAGPILLVLAIDQGAAFAAQAATATLLGVVALGGFVIAYVASSRRFNWCVALIAGWFAFAALLLALQRVHVGAGAALVVAGIALAATLRVLPRSARAGRTPSTPGRWDLPLRAACTVLPIVVVTAAARSLGPHLSGLLAAFPIITPVLAAFTHAQHGWREAAALLRGFTVGFFAYALFCFVVAIALTRSSVAAAFLLAFTAALAAQAAALLAARRRDLRAHALT